MTARVTINLGQLRDELLAATVNDRREIAHQIVDVYRGSAPVRSGRFRADAEVVVTGSTVAVVDDDETSVYKEYGTADTPPAGTLTNAARQFGKYTGWKPGQGGGDGKVEYVSQSGRVSRISKKQARNYNRRRGLL